MAEIQTLYVVNHSHTDIGFTDYQDICFRQHGEFIDQALDLCEATADYPEDARYRWTCEVTGTTERYLRDASPEQRDRFLHWHRRGAIDVGAMQYNLTPLLNVEQLHRSLYPVRRLREEYGIEIHSALQCDVNGVSWLFADLLPAIDIDFLTMAVNPIRGGVPKPRPAAFWWEGPAGNRILVWNGYHYLFGRSVAKLGDWRYVDRFLPPLLEKLERDPSYPYDFLYCQATHPIRVDNGPPDPRMPDFVRDWNAAGRTPRIAFTTPSAFSSFLRNTVAADLPTLRGDWTDWWADGVASSAYETGVSRSTHDLLGVAEMIGAWQSVGGQSWPSERLTTIYEQATLYDEHTWGGFASIEAPQALWTKAQWNHKALFAYAASSETHDVLARTARGFARELAEPGPEGVFNLGDLTPTEAYPESESSELLVLNTLPWARTMLVEEPEARGDAAPAGVLEEFFPRDVPWGGNRPPTPHRRTRAELPPLGYAFLLLGGDVPADDLRVAPNMIENAYYRVQINPTTGAVVEWLDKELNRNFAATYRGFELGQYIYESVESSKGREAIFVADFSHEDFGYGSTDTTFRHASVTEVNVHPPAIEEGVAAITVDVTAPGLIGGHCTVELQSGSKTLGIQWTLDKQHVTEPEAVFIAFPFALAAPTFRIDLNGIPVSPNQDQLPGTVRDWYPIQHWVDVSDDKQGVTLAPLDAPLVHLGGITTGLWAIELTAESATIMSWALHNHWMVNFKASQGGEIPLRYRLTTHAGPCDDAAAARFAAEVSTPPVILRDYRRTGAATAGTFARLLGDEGALLWAKPADDGDGIILRLQNLRSEPQTVPLQFDQVPSSLHLTSPVEVDGRLVDRIGDTVQIRLTPMAIQSLRLRL